MSVTLDYSEFLDWYVGGSFNVPYIYAESTSNENVLSDESVVLVQTYTGYNARRKPTVVANVQTTVSEGTSYSVQFNLYSYDYFKSNFAFHDFGVNKGWYIFDDFLMAMFKFEGSFDSDGAPVAVSLTVQTYYYDPNTGKLVTKIELQGVPLADSIEEDTLSSLIDNLAAAEADYTGAVKVVPINTTGSTGFNASELDLNKWSRYNYTEISPRAYLENRYDIIDDTYYGKATNVVRSPIDRLARLSAIDSGAWSKVPVGSSILECAARYAGITYNNIYYQLDDVADVGLLQILGAVDADVQYAYDNNAVFAGTNFADLKTLAAAVKSYYSLAASLVCNSLHLPRAYVPYAAAAIAYQDFVGSAVGGGGHFVLERYPKAGSLVIDGVLPTIMQYIAEDFSLTDGAASLVGYYNRYKGIMGFNGSYYGSTGGDNVKRLGVNAGNVGGALEAYRLFQALFLASEVDKALNALYQDASRVVGSCSLLNASLLPVQPGSSVKVVTSSGLFTGVVLGYNISLSADGNASATVDFAQRYNNG